MMMGVSPYSLRSPGGAPLAPTYQPYGFSPDATTAFSTPGVYYRPLNLSTGQPATLFNGGPHIDGAIIGNGQPFFDGQLSWNQDVGSSRVTAAINDLGLSTIQGDQLFRWQNGLYPSPPNLSFPTQPMPLAGTPANPFGGFTPYNPYAPMPGMPGMLPGGQPAYGMMPY